MRWVPAPVEMIVYTILCIAGLILIYEGTTDQSSVLLIVGALSTTLALPTLVYAIRNALWHRRMLRESPANEKLDLG